MTEHTPVKRTEEILGTTETREPTRFEKVLADAVRDAFSEAEIYTAPSYVEESFTDAPTADILTTITSKLVLDNGVCSGEIYVATPDDVESFVRLPDETCWFVDVDNRDRRLSNADMLGYVQNVLQTPITAPESMWSNKVELGEEDFLKATRETIAVNVAPDYSVQTFVVTTPYIEHGELKEEDDVTIGRMRRGSDETYFIVIPITAERGAARSTRHPGAAEKSKGYGSFDVTNPEGQSLTIQLRIEFPSDGSAPTYKSYYHDASGEPLKVDIDSDVISPKYILDAVGRFFEDKCTL